MRTSLSTLLLVAFFLGLPFALVWHDFRVAKDLQREERVEAIRETASRRLEAIRRTATRHFQLNRVLAPLAELPWGDIAQRPVQEASGWYADHIARQLPTHDLVVYSCGSSPRRLFSRFRGVGLPSSFGRIFARWVADPGQESLRRLVAAGLSRMSSFPVSQEYFGRYSQAWNGFLQVYRSDRGTRGLFYRFLTPPVREDGKRAEPVLCLALLALERLPPQYALEASLRQNSGPDCGLAFVSSEEHSVLTGPFFRHHPQVLADLRLAASGSLTLPAMDAREGLLLYRSYAVPGTSFFPVLAFPDPQGADPGTAAVLFASLGLGFLLSFRFCVERLVLGRGRELGLRQVIILVFVLVTLPPLASTGSLLRQAMAERERKERQELARELHDTLAALDQNVIAFQAEMVRWMRSFSERLPFLKAVLEEERDRKRPDFLASFVLDLESFLRTPLHPREQAIFSTVGIMGPKDFFRSWPVNPPENSLSGKGDDFLRTLSYLRSPELTAIAGRQAAGRPGGDRPSKAVGPLDTRDMFLEMAYDRFNAIGGPDIMLGALHFPNRIAAFTTVTDQTQMYFTPVRWQGALHSIMAWVWRGIMVDVRYLFENIALPMAGKEDPTLYALQRKPRRWTEAIPGLRPDLPLHELAERADDSGMTLKATLASGSERMLLEAMPGRGINNFILAGKRDARGVDRLSVAGRLAFRLAMSLSFLFAILVAWRGANHVLKPLGDLEEGIEAINRQEYGTRLDERRRDEFGALAMRFNEMARGLQEGQILRQFVSSSVHRAVEGETPELATGSGELCEVTVLFSALVGFDEFQATHPPTDVFPVLEAHLNAFADALGRYGGEIDKVIGDKILVVFRHAELGGPVQALEKVLEVVRTVEREMALGCPLPAAIGINTGPVISGILGAPTVRLDLTVIGDTVNLAARLATLAHTVEGPGRVILSHHAKAYCPADLDWEKLPFKRVKGKTQEVEAFLWKHHDG